MQIAKLILEYVEVLIWPTVALLVLALYRKAILSLIGGSKVKFSLFGITVETTIPQLTKSITATARIMLSESGGELTEQQRKLLEEISERSHIPVKNRFDLSSMAPGKDLQWIRPLRNAGLIMTLPDGKYIEQAEDIILTPLGELLMQTKQER